MKKPSKLKVFFVRKMFELSQDSIEEVEDGLTSSQDTVALCRRLAAEGCVLVKNEEKVLPVLPDDKVAIFGRCQNDYFYVGYGSGGDVKAPYKVSPMEAFEKSNMQFDKELADIYKEYSKTNEPDDGVWGLWPTCYDEMLLDAKLVADVRKRTDKAICFIGRSAGEDRESLKEDGSWYLTKEEEIMLSLVSAEFDKVCVVLNVGNIIDMSWVERYGIESVLYAWQGGQESGNALCDVITGRVNPSGKLADTIAPIEEYPSTAVFGDKKEPVYVEDIYVGYRYFETFKPDVVQYPFGFGLSYTSFNVKGEVVSNDGPVVKVKGVATNVGDVKGSEVIQVYMKAPDGKLGKPNRELVAFTKTKEIEPGKSSQTTMTIDLREFASYDDTGVTGHINTYILEAGDYEIYVGSDVRSASYVGVVKLDEVIVRKTLEAYPPNRSFERLVKRANQETYEKVPQGTRNIKERILKQVPLPMQKVKDDNVRLSDVKAGKITMDYFVSCLSTDELECLQRGSLDAMHSKYGPAGNTGCFAGTQPSLQEKGIPAICTNDGPSGVRLQAHSTLFPIGAVLASSFDPELVEKTAGALAKEVVERKSHVLLAPGMNIHRNPLCGRNFEYFSEDPYLTGVLGTSYVKGVQENGASAVPKHVCCNNQETARNTSSSLVSQRALREIYLRGFERCIKEAKPHCLMNSYNKVNGVYSYYSYDLNRVILRDEFGFDGIIMTDWWIKPGVSPEFPAIKNQALRVRAGNNILMPGADVMGKYKHIPDGSIMEGLKADEGLSLGELQRNAKEVLTYCLKHI